MSRDPGAGGRVSLEPPVLARVVAATIVPPKSSLWYYRSFNSRLSSTRIRLNLPQHEPKTRDNPDYRELGTASKLRRVRKAYGSAPVGSAPAGPAFRGVGDHDRRLDEQIAVLGRTALPAAHVPDLITCV